MATPDEEKTLRVDSDVRLTPRPAANEPQFAPGSVIAGRYRISGILGRGGMGEVYRADDVKLNQTVALKFLPARLARDQRLLGKLHDEVRLGRQVAHPNVCRIYDIAEWEGAHFLAMEYVDGEDLARLLHRIGRLAHDKAVDIARGIAAGLLAAHAKGILHRDLKPANVMIDSHGDARITDFGLALSAADEREEEIAGTPAYMAPELLEGTPATIQSDLYALGLVMYELFTGRRAHAAKTYPDRLRELSSEVRTPSSHIPDIDPAVERIILRCLANDPTQRPRSAREVIESLPGGDPLAAAMAAGETPSPRIVAAAGTAGSLKPAVAWSLLALIVAEIAVAFWLERPINVLRLVKAKSPEVLTERASTIRAELGLPAQPFSVTGWEENARYLAWLNARDKTKKRWEKLRHGPALMSFWLRSEKEPQIRDSFPPAPTLADPPQVAPGTSTIAVDPTGRLISLSAVPDISWPARRPDWSRLFSAAGFDLARFTPAAARMLPPAYADTTAAWRGTHPDDGTPVRVEAAAWHGVPVFFRIAGAWDDEPDRSAELEFRGSFHAALAVMFFIALTAGILLAARNLRLRRGDRPGAIRVGIVIFFLQVLAYFGLSAHALSFGHELDLLVRAVGSGLLWAAGYALVYIALEPYIRRRWPDRLISWARLIAGNWRDAMVGRDLLIGIAGGLAHAMLAIAAGSLLGNALHDDVILTMLDNPLAPIAFLAKAMGNGMAFGLTFMVALMILTMVLRRRGLATAGFFIMQLTLFSFGSSDPRMFLFFVPISAIMTLMVARYGLLAIIALQGTFGLIFFSVMPTATSWYTAAAAIPTAFALALAIWAFKTSLGGQSPWHAALLDG